MSVSAMATPTQKGTRQPTARAALSRMVRAPQEAYHATRSRLTRSMRLTWTSGLDLT